MEDQIKDLVTKLQNYQQLEMVTNPYSDSQLADNLIHYFELLLSFPYSGHLLVGEAPGYKGCTQCGIPFTSQRVINERDHPFITQLRSMVKVDGNQTEITATKVWNQLNGKSSMPAFWNTFPFHPWVAGDQSQNRKPSKAEIEIGLSYLESVVEILSPHTIVAVGGVASEQLKLRYPNLEYKQFSHPSMRGYSGFVSGFSALGLE